MSDAADLKQLFKDCMPLFIVLGDEIRLTIIEALTDTAFKTCKNNYSLENLSRHGLNVKEITKMTNLSRPAVSHHLKLLKDSGLISVRHEGTSNYYYLTITESTKKLMELGTRLQAFFS